MKENGTEKRQSSDYKRLQKKEVNEITIDKKPNKEISINLGNSNEN